MEVRFRWSLFDGWTKRFHEVRYASRRKTKWIVRESRAMRLSWPIKRMVRNDCNYFVARVAGADWTNHVSRSREIKTSRVYARIYGGPIVYYRKRDNVRSLRNSRESGVQA